MDDSSHPHSLEPARLDSSVAIARRPVRPPARQLVPPSIVQKMVERPVTTAVIFTLLGAFAAEGLALLFARAQARDVLQRSALRNLQLAQELDTHHDPLD